MSSKSSSEISWMSFAWLSESSQVWITGSPLSHAMIESHGFAILLLLWLFLEQLLLGLGELLLHFWIAITTFFFARQCVHFIYQRTDYLSVLWQNITLNIGFTIYIWILYMKVQRSDIKKISFTVLCSLTMMINEEIHIETEVSANNTNFCKCFLSKITFISIIFRYPLGWSNFYNSRRTAYQMCFRSLKNNKRREIHLEGIQNFP